mmetsp:Transcript_113192/g.283354  ORF Transcript_113192/g.283354 Transcript_113192/m.283354 type:complete len:259 (-) Transcript_113192:250-1026(-)
MASFRVAPTALSAACRAPTDGVVRLAPAMVGEGHWVAPPGLGFEQTLAAGAAGTPPGLQDSYMSLDVHLAAPYAPQLGSDAAQGAVHAAALIAASMGARPTKVALAEASSGSGSCSTADTESEEPPAIDGLAEGACSSSVGMQPVAGPTVLHLERFLAPVEAASADNQVVRLEDATAGQLLGSASLPLTGSAAHWTGQCKPCAFLYKVGCQNGDACDFCHLCPPEEKQRRKKERKEMRKMMRFACQLGVTQRMNRGPR